jgi:predicted nucleic acid-binding protein
LGRRPRHHAQRRRRRRNLNVVIADTSAWIEYLRATESRVHQRLRSLVSSERELATTEVVLMEVLAGAHDEAHAKRLRQLVLTCELIPARELVDYEEAAALQRSCRAAGETVRSMLDCLIAAVALREDAEVLHADRDFTVLSRHTPLRIAAT